MSVILDALKKLDREKSLRRQSTTNLAVEILKPDIPQPESKLFRYGVIILLTALGTGAITYFTSVYLMKRSSPPALTVSSAPSQKVILAPKESDLPQTSSVPPMGDSSTVSPPIEPAPIYREPLRETRKETSQAQVKTEGSARSKVSGEDKVVSESKPLTSILEEKKESRTVLPEKQEVIPKSVPSKDPQTQVAGSPIAPSLLKVSAIVWYEDPSMRFAIINGLKVTEGSFIEGAKVVEIKPTSVRLLHQEKYFELSIDR